MKPLARLYAIADASFGDPVQLAVSLFNGGARLLQVRNKNGSSQELLHQVERILSFAPPDADVVVNDRVDVALITGAAGVHLGQTDLPVVEARRILGFDRIIGFSTHTMEQAMQADRLPVDYIAAGPVFPTSTKASPDPVIGIAGLAQICKVVTRPVVAIGGINLQNAADTFKAGASSVAVISGLLSHSDIRRRVEEWNEALSSIHDNA
jgi:thiamine-phosphate pyrophosphorylase